MTARIASLGPSQDGATRDERLAPRSAAEMPLRFRPHHFLCSLGFAGAGYDDDFTVNMEEIVMGRLRARDGDTVEIEVVEGLDAICAPCPNNAGEDCTNAGRIRAIDARHAAALGLHAGERLTWGEARARIRAQVAPGDLARLCAGCPWLELGLCEAALAALHRDG